MSVPEKFQAGSPFPAFGWQRVGGGIVTPSRADGWRLLVVYRGKHCPLCRKYLTTLDGLQAEFADADVTLWAISADPLERATSEVADEGWTLPVLAGLNEEEMRTLGLYISSPRSPDETDRNFAEPALFVINPDGAAQVVDVSNAPFSRPDLAALLSGIRFVQAKHYPVRGIAG